MAMRVAICIAVASLLVASVHAQTSSEPVAAAIPQLANLVLFDDNSSGEVFYFDADKLPSGGQDPIRLVLLKHNGEVKTLLQMIQEKNENQEREPAQRADLRFGTGPDGQIFLLNIA